MNMNQKIQERLAKFASDGGFQILHAAESGSRAWGFASPDSDYDVRFLYVRPRDWYLRLESARDVVEYPIDAVWDVNGWDLQKALRLLRGSNPTLFEWLGSPIVYQTGELAGRLHKLTETYFQPKPGLYHYLSMAQRNYKTGLQGDAVRAKKYFYALRPLLACLWILERKSPPPVPFLELAESQLPERLRPEVERLLAIKQDLPESGEIARIPVLDRFLEEQFSSVRARADQLPPVKKPDWQPLNEMFLDAIEWKGVCV